MAPRVEIGILGPLRVTVDGRAVRLPAKQQVLLAVLVLDHRAVAPERLMMALWGEDAAPTALRTLQSHVFQLRRALVLGGGSDPMSGAHVADVVPGDSPWIETDGRGYRLRIEPDAVDASRFESLVTGARGHAASDPRAGVTMFTEALGLWRGQDVVDVGGESMATAELDRLVELRHGAFDELVRLRMSLGETTEVIPELRHELRANPYREPLWGSLMRALDASGRKAEALLAYREATEALRRELDVEPDEELRALADRIREDSHVPAARATPEITSTIADPHDDPTFAAPSDVAPSGIAATTGRRLGRGGLVLVGVLVSIVLATAGTRLLPASGTSSGPSIPASGAIDPGPAGTDLVTLLDADGRVGATTALGGRPGDLEVGAGSLWVGSPTDGTVLRLDLGSWDVIQRIHVGGTPAGIAAGFGAIWVADSSGHSVSRIDPTTDQVVASVGVGAAPEGVATDARWVWVADRLDHAVTRIDPTDGSARSFALGATPLGVAVAAGWVWVVDGGNSEVAQVDPSDGTVVRTIAVGSDPTAITASPNGDAVWVTNTGSGTVFRIDTASSTVTAAAAVGRAPTGIVVDATGVWVAVSGTDEVVRLDPTSAMVTGRTAMSGGPASIGLTDGGVVVTTGAAAGTHRGGLLHILDAPGDLSETADPTYAEWYQSAVEVLTNDSLVTFKRVGGPDGLTIVPDLAAAIPTPQDGGRTWTFHLRPGVVYSDGRAVRAKDALGSFERGVLAGNAAQTGAGIYGNIEIIGSAACGSAPPCDLSNGITTDDSAGTVTFHLTMSDPDFPSRITGVPIVPDGTPLTDTRTPVPATGPYQIVAFDPGRSERLVRNPRFAEWSPDAQPDGNPDEIDIAVSHGGDPTTEVLTGRADILELGSEPAARLGQLRTQVPAQLHVAPSDATWFEVMNTRLPPFDDPRVRQAVELATDRNALVDAWGGPLVATVTCQVVPPGFAGYSRYCPWTVDPSPNGDWLGPDLPRARALIAATGVHGAPVTVWGLDDGGQHAAVARYFTGLLGDLGLTATTRLLDPDRYFTFVREHPEQVQMSGHWNSSERRVAAEAIIGSYTCPSYPDAYQSRPGGWCDPALDIRIQAAVQLERTDPIAADDAWARIDHTIVDAAPAVMAFNPTTATLLSARTGGYEAHPVFGVLYDQLWVR